MVVTTFKSNNNIAKKNFLLAIFLTIALDPSGDYMIALSDDILQLFEITRFITILVTPLLVIIGFFDLAKCNSNLRIFITGIFIISLWGLINGLINNIETNAIREFLPYFYVMCMPIAFSIGKKNLSDLIEEIIKALLVIGLVKIFASQLISYTVQGVLSWKIILRISPLFIMPYVFYTYKMLHERFNIKTILLVILSLILILAAQARALNLCLLISTVFLARRSFLKLKILTLFFIIFIAGLLTTFITDFEFSQIFGIWSGEHFNNTVNYRHEQLDIIFSRYIENGITGYGFGYYTPGYRIYNELNLPYLLEMDIINFTTKVGIPLSIIYILLIFYLLTIKHKNQYSNIIFTVSKLTIFLLYFYSIFQTFHSGILFWMIFSICGAFILLNSDKRFLVK